jgi:hypothetical protein
LKYRGITGSQILPRAELSYSLEQAASRTINGGAEETPFTLFHFHGPCPPYAEKIDHSAGEVAKNMSRRCQSIVKKEKKTF